MNNLILLTFFIGTLNSYTQEKNCFKFKTGNFEYSDAKYTEWKVTRTDSTQIEVNTKTDIEIYSSIQWLNDCEYILTCTKVKNPTSDNIIGKVYHVKITDVFSNRYNCIAVAKNDDIALNLLMIKVETFSN